MPEPERPASLAIKGGLCLLPGQGLVLADITCCDGRIADISPHAGSGLSGIDASGCLVLPGIVDLHGDAFERQIMPRPRTMFPVDLAMQETDSQLVANGITTAYHGVSVSWEPGLRSLAQAQEIARSIKRFSAAFRADHQLHIRWETFALDAREGVKAMLESFPSPILAFNDHTTGMLAPGKRAAEIRRAADRAMVNEAACGLLLAAAEERRTEVPAAIAEMAEFARRRGIAMLSHDDETAQARYSFRALGAELCEFPKSRAALDAAAAAGDPVLMGAPNVLRGGSHNGAIGAEESIRQGKCTILASDYYYPAPLRAALALAESGALTLERAWALVSDAPARAAGLADRGRIALGLRADLVVIPVDGVRPVATVAAGKPVLSRL